MSITASAESQSGSKKRHHDYHQNELPRKSRKLSQDVSSASEDRSREVESFRSSNKHTKKERKQNRSTRIHSLRKLLARGTLPSTIQQEKERELAALIHEQDKTRTKKEAKKTLERYHYVRFVERQKAEKRLKRLRKQKDAGSNDSELERKIHEMEVNRNYAIYAPLGQKYVSMFASHACREKNGEVAEDELDDITKDNVSPVRPPMWYIVEAAMARGESELKALRDGKSGHMADTRDDDERPDTLQSKNKSEATSLKLQKRSAEQVKREQVPNHEVDMKREASEDEDERSDGGFFDR
ncbi:rRNA-processing protein efg1 [Neophaeococcomyces mojaviensis]|uniref:rRNA-processing protein efg1 n=1 Tax=Neophaeococcomyces mojaviensis TaxID=3383035 RepID=A0ACC3AKL5_9EURO|nr:rRNA-processing protein efg1 [Knufia sp. JES_112]